MIKNIDTLESMLFDCQCALFIIDITDPESLDQIEKLFEEIKFSDFSHLKKILVENKIDAKREISEENIKNFIDNNNIEKNFRISVKNGQGIEELANQVKEYLNYLEKDIPNNFCSQIIDENDIDTRKKGFKTSLNIIFIGNSMVGKTSLFLRLDRNFFKESFISTIGIEKISKSFKYKDDLYKVNLIDTAGQDRYRTLPRRYYKNTDGVFLLFDLSNKDSFNDISIWITELKDNYDNTQNKDKGPVVYLLGNKLDSDRRVITKEEAEDKANFYGIKYFEISCKLNMNIPEIYSRMIIDCIENLKTNSEQLSFSTKIKKKKVNKSNDLCCN